MFGYKLDGSGDALALNINLDSTSAKALARLDRYINWGDVLKLTENDLEAANAAERLHTECHGQPEKLPLLPLAKSGDFSG